MGYCPLRLVEKTVKNDSLEKDVTQNGAQGLPQLEPAGGESK